jgi:hypothetical protein
MVDEGERKRTNAFWLILPFIITSCFIIPMVVYGINSGEKGSYWVIFLPGVALCIFPWAKILALVIQTRAKIWTLQIPEEMYESNLELNELKNKGVKWAVITPLTWIVVFLSMMVAVGIYNAGKPQDKPIPSTIEQRDIREVPVVSGHSEGKAETREKPIRAGEKIPLAFIENSNVHKHLQFYDTLIYRLIPIPFLGMLAGAVFLIRVLIGRWWKWKKIPLGWKIVPFVAIACFILPIESTFIIAAPMDRTIMTETLRFLNSLSDNANVIINGKAVDNPSDVISKLKTLAKIQAHHSHPTQRIRIQVLNSDYSLTLELGRDSDIPSEYWVFYPGYRHSRLNEIGRINTTIFDKY